MRTLWLMRAFTLIEILLVVAIIAILSAIAVPNLTDAHVRANVSRAKAEMRAIAAALEAYRADEKTYPPDAKDTNYALHWRWHLLFLTTPVAYLTGVPDDAFQGAPEWGPRTRPYWYATPTGYGSARHSFGFPGLNLFDGGRENFRWAIASVGPDLMYEYHKRRYYNTRYTFGGDAVYYDPTNGTRSDGDLFWYGPGGGPNP